MISNIKGRLASQLLICNLLLMAAASAQNMKEMWGGGLHENDHSTFKYYQNTNVILMDLIFR